MERPALGIDFSREDRLAASQNQKKGSTCYEVYVFLLQQTLQITLFFFFFQSADQGCASTKGLQILTKVKLRLNASDVVPCFVKRDAKLLVVVVF